MFFHAHIFLWRLLRNQSRRFFFKINDTVPVLKTAAKGGSRHEA
jgi:hypothetical protein